MNGSASSLTGATVLCVTYACMHVYQGQITACMYGINVYFMTFNTMLHYHVYQWVLPRAM